MKKRFIDFEDREILIIETNIKNIIDIFKNPLEKLLHGGNKQMMNIGIIENSLKIN